MIIKDWRRRKAAVFWGGLWLAATVLTMASCAGSRPNGPPSASQAGALDAIAAIVVGNPVHSTNYVDHSQMGGGRVIVGERYFSALGIPCQRAMFVNPGGQEYDLAVCAEKSGDWATAPDIFVASRPGTMN